MMKFIFYLLVAMFCCNSKREVYKFENGVKYITDGNTTRKIDKEYFY